jgi:hypothetical protein
MASGDQGCFLFLMFGAVLLFTSVCVVASISGILLAVFYATPPSLTPLTPFQQLVLDRFNIKNFTSANSLDENTFTLKVDGSHTMVFNVLRALDKVTEDQLFAQSAEVLSANVACCLSSGIYLPLDKPFVVYTNDYPSSTASTAVTHAIATWESVIPSLSIFGNYQINIVDTPSNDALLTDTANQIIYNRVYAGFDDVLAITWRSFNSRYITQWNMFINSGTYQIGDVTQVHAGRMYDGESLILHELGHTLGLNDLTSTSCIQAIMYGYLQSETQKRTVDVNSKYCLVDLYPDSANLKSLLDQYSENLNVGDACKVHSLLFYLNPMEK